MELSTNVVSYTCVSFSNTLALENVLIPIRVNQEYNLRWIQMLLKMTPVSSSCDSLALFQALVLQQSLTSHHVQGSIFSHFCLALLRTY